MEVVRFYPLKIIKWEHLPLTEFVGNLHDNGYSYVFGLTPQDPKERDCFYFTVHIKKRIDNISTNKKVLDVYVQSGVKIKNYNQIPEAEFLFSLVTKITALFAQEFYNRSRNTTISHHKISIPRYAQLKNDLKSTIEIYQSRIHNPNAVIPPNWKLQFKNFPAIPPSKQWRDNQNTTVEHDLSFKLLHGHNLTVNEEEILRNLRTFYEELDEKLLNIDYTLFSEQDFEDFKSYILYAFNYTALISNRFSFEATYRLIINTSVIGSNSSIQNSTYLSYPPLEKVKKANYYNRANTPNTHLFYSTGNIDTALKELKPKVGTLVTVGVWKPKDPSRKFLCYPISHSEKAFQFNEGVQQAARAFVKYTADMPELGREFIERYFKVLGREFSKPVQHHYEYFISAMFSEHVLKQYFGNNPHFKFEGIIYPSVGNNYITDNLALLPHIVHNHLRLDKVIEFTIQEAYYEKDYEWNHPEVITLAKIENFRETTSIKEDGTIEW